MPIYNYKAVKEGKEYEASKEASDKQALFKEVRAEGGMIISVKEGKEKKGLHMQIGFLTKIKNDQKIAFAKNLAVMLEAGIPLSRALSILGKQSQNAKLSKVIESLRNSIDQGKSLSEAMKDNGDVFSNLFIMMVKSGEESGKIVQSLRLVAGQLERSNSLTKKIKGAMIYPSIVITIMLIIGVLLMVYMVPTLTSTFKGLNVPLPLPTRIIIGISDFLRANIIYLMGLLIAAFIGISYFFKKTLAGSRVKDFIVLHLPLITPIVKEVNSARTARTLSSLISSGVDIVVAIGVTRDVLQNSYYKKILEKAGETIQAGGTISSVLNDASHLYPIYVGEMAAVGEETGELSPMLENIAQYYEDEVDQRTKDLSTIIEPVLMVVIGAAVGVFAIAMLMPTYSLVDVIQ